MKKDAEKRIEKILESDRLGLAEGAERIIKNDIENLLIEYFALKKRPEIVMSGDGENIDISIFATAKGIKKFNMLK